MASHARSESNVAYNAPAGAMPASAFARMIFSTVEEPSDAVPALRAMTLFGLIGGSVLAWAAIGAAAWSAFV